MTSFLLLNPDFFFGASGPAEKAVLALFFGVVFIIPPPPKLLFNLRAGGFSRGTFGVQNSNFKKSGHVRKTLKVGALYRKAGLPANFIQVRPWGVLYIFL
jgi:hypothetical protein